MKQANFLTAFDTPTIPADIAAAAAGYGLIVEVVGDITKEENGHGLLLYWPEEAPDLPRFDPLWPVVAREWLEDYAPRLARRRLEAMR